MRLIVTGASGFIGRNLLLRVPRTWEVFAVYNRAADFLDFVRRNRLDHVRPVQCDLTRGEQVRELSAAVGRSDASLYLAANGDPSQSAKDPLWDLQSNTVALLTFLEQCPVSHLVYLSSGAVYEGVTGPVSPDSPVNPKLPYAVSKLASEGYIRFYAEKRRTPDTYTIVRFFGAYGPHEPPRKITTRFLRAVADARHELTLRGDGQNLIELMYVDDAVEGLLRLVNAPGGHVTLDFASGAPVKLDDLVREMARALGVEMTIRHEGDTAEYIRFYSVDSTMRDRFGFASVTPLHEGLKRLQLSLKSHQDAAARVA